MTSTLEQRLEVLEGQVADLNRQLEELRPKTKDWTRSFGLFAGDPHHESAVRLGREWREAQTCEKEIAGS
jgi:hypothetical protein